MSSKRTRLFAYRRENTRENEAARRMNLASYFSLSTRDMQRVGPHLHTSRRLPFLRAYTGLGVGIESTVLDTARQSQRTT